MKKRDVLVTTTYNDLGTIIDTKTQEITRCKDCEYWWKENELCTHENTVDGNVCCLECGPEFFCGYAKNKSEAEYAEAFDDERKGYK